MGKDRFKMRGVHCTFAQKAEERALKTLKNPTIHECTLPCKGPNCHAVIRTWRNQHRPDSQPKSNLKNVICEAKDSKD